MIRKNAIAERFDNAEFDGDKSVEVSIRDDFGLPDHARRVKIEIFMKKGGVRVKDGGRQYAGQVKERWGQLRGVIDVLPEGGIFYLDFDRHSTLARIGCLGYFE